MDFHPQCSIWRWLLICTSVAGTTQGIMAMDPAAAAQTDAGDATLGTIVVTATGSPAEKKLSPYTVDTVTATSIRKRQVRTVPEALRETPGVMVQKTAHGQGSPYIRGFTGFRNLLLIDGIRLNNSVFREGPNQYWNTLDPLSVERFEVIKGQGSLLFGSDAIGGTVNALTKSALPAAEASGALFAHGNISYRWASAEQSHIARLETDLGKAGSYGLHLGLSLKDFGDLKAATLGTLSHTGYQEWDVDTKLDLQLNADTQLSLAYQRVTQDDAWRTHKTMYGKSWRGTDIGSEQRRSLDQLRQLAYAQLRAEAIDSPLFQTMRLSLSWQNQSEEQDRIREKSDGRRDVQGIDVHTLGLIADFTAESPIGLLTYGASWYHDRVDSFRRNYDANDKPQKASIQGPVGDDSTYDLISVYLQDQITPADGLDIYLGGNLTYARADIGRAKDPVSEEAISISDSWSNFSTSLRGVWAIPPANSIHLFGGISQGFRAPNLSDLSRLDSARSNEIETPSPGLAPERYILTELGIRMQTDTFSASASYYYTFINDMIVRAPTGRVIDGDHEVTKRNSGRGHVQGIELEARWRFAPEWIILGNLTWMDGKVDTYPTSAATQVGEPLDRLMPLTVNLGLRWQPTDRLWLELWSTAAARADRLSTRDRNDTQRIPPGGTPGYVTLALRGGYDLTEHFSILAAVENITDTDYRVHGSGQNEAGRNYVVTGSVTF